MIDTSIVTNWNKKNKKYMKLSFLTLIPKTASYFHYCIRTKWKYKINLFLKFYIRRLNYVYLYINTVYSKTFSTAYFTKMFKTLSTFENFMSMFFIHSINLIFLLLVTQSEYFRNVSFPIIVYVRKP